MNLTPDEGVYPVKQKQTAQIRTRWVRRYFGQLFALRLAGLALRHYFRAVGPETVQNVRAK